MSMLNILENLGKIWHPFLRQNADNTNQACYSSGSKCTSTEAEEEEFIAGLVVRGNKVIPFTDIFREAWKID